MSRAKQATLKPPNPAARTTRLRWRMARHEKMPIMEARNVMTRRSSRLP